jgi:hypothetical protein
MFPTSLYSLDPYYPKFVFLSMDYSNMWWNDAIEIPLMVKHVQIIKHFEKKYGVKVNRDITFGESTLISEMVTKIKFLKVRKVIDTKKAGTLFRLVCSTDQESMQMGLDMIQQLLAKARKKCV